MLELWLHLLAAVLAVTLARGLIVFLVAWCLTQVAKKMPGEFRYAVWMGVIGGFVLIPLAWLLLPPIRLNAWIRIQPASSYRLAAAVVLSRSDYALLIEKARQQAWAVAPPATWRVNGLLLTLVLAWLIGILFLGARLLWGRSRLHRIVSQAKGHGHLQALTDRLSARSAVRTRIRLLLSPACRVPFACGILRPAVLLPADAERWPQSRLKAALAHELAHIRRGDLVVQCAGYIVCVLFWFAPPVWLAYAAMLGEAETCCDQQVINWGFRGPEYARDILELARNCQGRILLPSTSSAIGRERMLKNRIRRVLSLEPGLPPRRGRRVLRAAPFGLIGLVLILALTAQAKPLPLPSSDAIFGTWVNAAYDKAVVEATAKMVLTPEGNELDFRKVADSEPFAIGKLTTEAVWIDAEGNRWYKMVWIGDYNPAPAQQPRFKCFLLARVNPAGDILETINGQKAYPRDLKDVSCSPCLQYYRQ